MGNHKIADMYIDLLLANSRGVAENYVQTSDAPESLSDKYKMANAIIDIAGSKLTTKQLNQMGNNVVTGLFRKRVMTSNAELWRMISYFNTMYYGKTIPKKEGIKFLKKLSGIIIK